MAEQRLSLVTPKEGQDDVAPFGEVIRTGGTVTARRNVVPVVHRDGSTAMVELTVWPVGSDGRSWHAGLFQVLDQRATERAVCCGGAIVESTDAAIMSESLDGRILSWNGGAQAIYGYSAEEALRLHAAVLTPPSRVTETAGLYERACQGEAITDHETLRVRKDGSLVDVALTVSPIHDMRGQVVGVSTVARDISEAMRMKVALQTALDEARRAEERSRRFLADAAHQLRNPLAGVRACADALLRAESTDGRERLLARLIDDVARAAGLVNRLLRVARLDQGEEPRPIPSDLVALCRTEGERAGLLAPHLEVMATAAGLDAPVSVDADVAREILSNLLDNACRYARSRVDVVAGLKGDTVVVSVSDDGPGMSPDQAQLVFQRFATLGHLGGSGLGLPIARGLARAHGGDLTYENGRFILRLAVGKSSDCLQPMAL